MFEVLKAIGIKADGIIGHSHGENSCAYADGCLSLEETMLVSWTRGAHSIEMNTIKGMMAAVGTLLKKLYFIISIRISPPYDIIHRERLQ